ncbi:MAG TPA: glycosyltransferase family 4 protein [Solirubrobacteraceae bacterium]|jgi:UDP-glucose:(heptosyl)LPS alpha-1,3-glucosyltransferase|nr:glycosyltransferase family 4 protein [Solirubrobacteraceae bacterium]
MHSQSEIPDHEPTHPGVDVTIVANDIGPVGGMERQLSDLILGLRRRGNRVTVIARTCALPEDAGIEFHRVRAPGRPFVIAYPWFMVAGSLALRRRRNGVVQATGAIVLNRVDVIAVHYCHQVGPANASRSTRLFRGQVWAARIMKRLGERVGFRVNRPTAVVCVSEGVAAEVREHFPSLAGRVLTIHNGVDTETFAPGVRSEEARARRASLGLPPEALVAAFVGSEWERKGLEPTIRALAQAPEWSLLIAGAGEQVGYRLLAERLGVAERIHWLGLTSDVQLVYQMADAFVLPSSYETFSLVTFEAAASGVPVLATPVSGVRELIDDKRNGFLISRDPTLIADRLARLAADPELRRTIANAARDSALAFASERMVAEHEALYMRLSGPSLQGGSASAALPASDSAA